MEPIGVNGPEENLPVYKKPEDITFAEISSVDKLPRTLAGLNNSVDREIKTAKSDEVVTSQEGKYLQKWYDKIKILYNQASCVVGEKYNDFAKKLKTKMDELQKVINSAEPEEEEQILLNEPQETSSNSYEPTEMDVDDTDLPESYKKDVKETNKRYNDYYKNMDPEELYTEIERRLQKAFEDKLAGTTRTKEQIAAIGDAIKKARTEDDLVKRLKSMGYSEQHARQIARG